MLKNRKEMTLEQKAIKAIYLSLIGNILLASIKWITGYFGNSYALIADAIESTSDILASLLVLFGLKYASRPADKNHPYGHGRIEPLMTFLVVVFLIISAFLIARQSIQNIQTPHEMPESYTLYVLAVIIIIKEVFYRKMIAKSKETNSSSLKADAWHHRSDAVTSFAAFIGISIALLLGKGYEAADDWAALFASVFILYNSFLILRPAIGEIMDEHFYDEIIDEIRESASTQEGVEGTEKCYVRKTGFKYYVDLHATVKANLTVKEGHEIAHQLKSKIMRELPQIANILIHIEPAE